MLLLAVIQYIKLPITYQMCFVIGPSPRSKRYPGRKSFKEELDADNGDYDGYRRSSRQRKLTFGSFNQTLIDKHLQLVQSGGTYEPRRTRQSDRHEEPKIRRKKISELELLKKEAGVSRIQFSALSTF